jgi:hypothetical protein
MTSTLFNSLQSAASCAVKQVGFKMQEIVLSRWAITYRCSTEDVEQAFKFALNGSRKLPEEVAASLTIIPIEEVDE